MNLTLANERRPLSVQIDDVRAHNLSTSYPAGPHVSLILGSGIRPVNKCLYIHPSWPSRPPSNPTILFPPPSPYARAGSAIGLPSAKWQIQRNLSSILSPRGSPPSISRKTLMAMAPPTCHASEPLLQRLPCEQKVRQEVSLLQARHLLPPAGTLIHPFPPDL